MSEDAQDTVAAGDAATSIVVEQNDVVASEQEADAPSIEMLSLTVKLPHEPFSIKIMVSAHETFNDIRQSILDLPSTIQYTCFSLWFNNAKLNDFLELHSVEGIHDGATLELREEAYNDREARAHVLKVRDIVGLISTKNDSIVGLSAGLSALSTIEESAQGYKDKTSELAHPMSDFDLDGPPVLQELLPPAEPTRPACIKSLGLSQWNPPPPNLRLRGHLLYLQVLSLEGAVHHITADISGFYTSNSSNQKFDPSPRKGVGKAFHAHSLLVLLQELSPLFREELLAWQTTLGQRDPLTVYNPTNALLAAPWLARPSPAPTPDISRTQEQLLVGGSDNLDTVRDWNEDLQSTREMPRSNIQERILRERLLNKLYYDFAEAAAKGAVLIARDEVPALNPNEARDAQIFLYNGIFFSYGADGIGTFAKEGGDPAARYAVGKDLAGVRFVNQLDIEGICPLCTVIVDYSGRRIVAQSPVPGIFRQREDGSNQIVYGGVDNRDVIANDKSFEPIFEKIAESLHLKRHTVWDKDSKPTELVTSVETKGLEGTDGRKYILDLYRITPLDIEFLDEFGEAAVPYPHKMAVLRPEAVEEWWKDQVRAWIAGESEKLKAEGKEAKIVYKTENGSQTNDATEEPTPETEKATENSETIEISGFKYALNPDVFSGQVPVTEDDKAAYADDGAEVRKVSKYITETLIPNLLADLQSGAASVPLDSSQLTKLLHKRGINMRYLGKLVAAVTESAADRDRLASFKAVLVHEIILRASKYVINGILKPLPVGIVPFASVHVFNSILGTKLNADPTIEIDAQLVSLYADQAGGPDFGFANLSAAEIQKLIADEALKRFRYALPERWVHEIRAVQLFREMSIKLGFQWRMKNYLFEKPVDAPMDSEEAKQGNGAPHPKTNGKVSGKHKKQNGHKREASPVAPTPLATTFVVDDLLNIIPVIKDSAMKSQLAEEAVEAGRISIMQGQKELGVELLLESLSLHEQVYGIIHPEVARTYSQLSMIYSGLDDKPAAADFARKAVLIAERTIGLDSSETVLMYLSLALCEHSNGNSYLALAYIRHAFSIWRIITGEGHPDSVTTMNNVAVMLQSLQEYHDSRQWFEASLALCSSIFGEHSINAATLYFQLAQALVLTQDSHGAVKKMRDAYTIFLNELGPEDKNTKESEVWLEQLTQSAVHYARQAKEVQNRKARKLGIVAGASRATVGGTSPIGIPIASATATLGSEKNGASQILPSSINTKSIEELVKYIGGNN
ncbi:clustered mitochondria-domain-containing protein [Lipomyces chichibuensis]|uniref:clustered mitochondria-domain-containing protein n=1 Tax=Lipomyces chichibuensis TaxID=1546026 RepID=UPI0033434A15